MEAAGSYRVNVTLDAERVAKLRLLSERTNTPQSRLAKSLLLKAIDEADGDSRHIVELLDGIPGAFERAWTGLQQARRGETIRPDDL